MVQPGLLSLPGFKTQSQVSMGPAFTGDSTELRQLATPALSHEEKGRIYLNIPCWAPHLSCPNIGRWTSNGQEEAHRTGGELCSQLLEGWEQK